MDLLFLRVKELPRNGITGEANFMETENEELEISKEGSNCLHEVYIYMAGINLVVV